MNKTLYLIPNTLGDSNLSYLFPDENKNVIASIRIFFVEEIKSARRLIAGLGLREIIDQSEFIILNKKTDFAIIQTIIKTNEQKNVGLISEAGCPAIADPGSELVRYFHENNGVIKPLIGPSSILLAVIASGLNGQNFAFNGYLPKQQAERIKTLKQLEQKITQQNQSQFFIETPYRNQHLFDDLIKHLHPQTRLCVAMNLTTKHEWIKTYTIAQWREKAPKNFQKQQIIFGIG